MVLFVALVGAGCVGDRESSSRPGRPQEPVPPLPYESENVRFENSRAGIQLAGTLTLPSGEGPHPAICLVSGSGPQDRDETVAGHKPFLVLADHLTRHGIAVLRFDDRGVGKSSGNFGTATMRDFASDVRAAVEFLQSRRDIDAGRIGLAGHSEGGMVAPMASLEMPGQIACLVLLASPGLPGEQILYLQDAAQARAQGVDEAAIERSRSRKERMFDVLKQEPDFAKAADKLRRAMKAVALTAEEKAEMAEGGVNVDDLINQQIRLLNNAATRFFLEYNPITALKEVDIPVLAVIGENDLQVPPTDNLPRIKAALATGECPKFVTRELNGLNHLLQRSDTGLPSEYPRSEETIAPSALELITNWVLGVFE